MSESAHLVQIDVYHAAACDLARYCGVQLLTNRVSVKVHLADCCLHLSSVLRTTLILINMYAKRWRGESSSQAEVEAFTTTLCRLTALLIKKLGEIGPLCS